MKIYAFFSATRNSASSAGGPACTQLIAVSSESPVPGAEIDAVFDGAEDGLVADGAAAELAVRVGVIGVSSPAPGLPAGTVEQPATSADIVTSRAIRMRSG
jgi:hypothetical protein